MRRTVTVGSGGRSIGFPMGLNPTPMDTAIPQAPLRSRTRDFPDPVLTLAFLQGPSQHRGEAQALTYVYPAHVGLPMNSPPRFKDGLPRLSVRDHPGGRQVPRAPLLHAGVTAVQEASGASSQNITSTSSLLRAHAPYRRPPVASGIAFLLQVFAGCCQPLLRDGPSRRYLCQSFPTCLDPYSGCSQGARARCFPQDIDLPRERNGSARRGNSDSYFCRREMSELQSFTDVQTHRFARHSGSSHLPPHGARPPWLLHPRLSRFVTSPCSGHAIRPNPGN